MENKIFLTFFWKKGKKVPKTQKSAFLALFWPSKKIHFLLISPRNYFCVLNLYSDESLSETTYFVYLTLCAAGPSSPSIFQKKYFSPKLGYFWPQKPKILPWNAITATMNFIHAIWLSKTCSTTPIIDFVFHQILKKIQPWRAQAKKKKKSLILLLFLEKMTKKSIFAGECPIALQNFLGL